MPQIRPQRRLVRGCKRYPNPNRIRRLVVAIGQVRRRLPCPRLPVVVQGVVNLHILVRVQARQLHLTVGALEVVAVDVQLPLNRTASTRAFVSVGRAQRRAYVVSNETRNRLIEVHAKGHQEPSSTGRHSQRCSCSLKKSSYLTGGS